MVEHENSKSRPEPTPPAEDQTSLVHEEHQPSNGPQPKLAGAVVTLAVVAIAVGFLIVAIYVGVQAFSG
ncbi:hypothetical protein IEU95_08790 [Hoyosella rhizosphaerae]|uniref:Uncharacterized protein n=1 Tax=Hoyosella rhizosphaerae TaxID=1755582 RepID=A0A916U0F8_9ACTN|nr:hypothetical protein [Hoyosella rhizosphaerae]MBN4926926.1 hypothetical protein [Hoyosella rhizosphaerae]GGC55425.1 hypothetical protein GCM10011410_04770 [Hoyosella rhizosphaerae]